MGRPKDRGKIVALQAKVDLQALTIQRLEAENRKLRSQLEHYKRISQIINGKRAA